MALPSLHAPQKSLSTMRKCTYAELHKRDIARLNIHDDNNIDIALSRYQDCHDPIHNSSGVCDG